MFLFSVKEYFKLLQVKKGYPFYKYKRVGDIRTFYLYISVFQTRFPSELLLNKFCVVDGIFSIIPNVNSGTSPDTWVLHLFMFS